MIWALLAYLFFGGTAAGAVSPGALAPATVDELGGRIEATLDEAGHQSEALLIVDSLRNNVAGFEKKFASSGKKLNAIYRDHSASHEDAQAVLDQLNADWEERQSQVLDDLFALREILSEDQWNELFGSELLK